MSILNNDHQEHTLKSTLQFLKDKVDEISLLKESGDKSHVEEVYKNELVPHLIRVRRLNRIERDNLESKYNKIKDLNKELLKLEQSCNCLKFEAACSRSGLDSSEDLINIDDNSAQLLDQEEERRRVYQEKKFKLEEETNAIEELFTSTASMVEDWKPSIKQLLDKVPNFM